MADIATNIVDLAVISQSKKKIDLRKDNRIGSLLDEYEDAVVVYLEAKRVRDELYAEIKEKMNGADEAIVDGWRLKMPWMKRREYTVKATTFQRLFLRRQQPRKTAGDSPTT